MQPNKIISLSCALVLGMVLAACEQAPPPVSQQVSPGALLEDFSGNWLLINYWAIWCKPCIEEIPELNRFAQLHPGKARVLTVNFDGVRDEELRQQAEQLRIRVPILEQDPGPALGISTPQVLPATLIVDPNMAVRETLFGPQTVETLLEALEATKNGG